MRGRPFFGYLAAAAFAVVALGWPVPATAATAPNDPLYPNQWALRRIGSPESWAQSQGAGTTIAIVDSGVNANAEDLKGKVIKQYDAVNGGSNAADLSSVSHGTSVASVAAANTNNRIGMAGAAPKAKLFAVRAFSALLTTQGDHVADAVMWAADNDADVINLSLGGALPVDFELTNLHEASMAYALAKGSLVVAAAGNAGDPFCSTPAFNPAVLCVGASDGLDRTANFSNYGLRLDVVAPGTGVTVATKFNTYETAPGTSVAAPFVSAVGAQLMSMGASNVLAGTIIRLTAKDLGLPGYDLTYGFGRLDAKAAVDLCAQICPLLPALDLL